MCVSRGDGARGMEKDGESIESGLRDITVDFPKVLYSANTLCLREPLTENEYWK